MTEFLSPPIYAEAPAAAPTGTPAPAEIRGSVPMLIRNPLGITPEEGLPENARRRLRQLQAEADEARAIVSALIDRQQALIDSGMEFRGRLARAEAQRLGSGHPEVMTATAQLARNKIELADVENRLTSAGPRSGNLRALCENLERYILRSGERTIVEHDKPTAKIAATTNLPLVLEKTRNRIAELKADLHQVRSAPVMASEAKAAAASLIAELSESGRPHILPLLDGDRRIDWPSAPSRVRGAAGSQVNNNFFTDTPDAAGLTAWLFKDALIAKVHAEIDDLADDASALSATERAKKETEIKTELLDVERQEAAIVQTMAGVAIVRPDADPRAVLGLADNMPAPRDEF